MEKSFITKIGTIRADDNGMRVELEPEYIPALEGLSGFSHVNLLWWFSGCDNADSRGSLTEISPYKAGPASLGTFATRSPARPNPVALSCAAITHMEGGTIWLDYIDAENGSPVIDIKPYEPSMDRVEKPSVPPWRAHWPASREESAAFDWQAEFNF